ncbi:MAG TPA: SMP-30/gluconolactonase/LRE family protein [Pirellulales bacterium]|jgi:gluconolactonase|nr:SMP-30/gluconolactonase/LRE family protein [Pirellulales bacterium]
MGRTLAGVLWIGAALLCLPTLLRAADMNMLSDDEKQAGFELLFNGRDFDGWEQKGNWIVEDGAIFRRDRAGDLKCAGKKIPDDFELRFDWKVGPGSNSGVYYRPTQYEYQILDNSKHADGRNPRTSAASLYFCMPPSHDVTRPVGDWNSGRVVCQGSVIQHWLNGEKVIDIDYNDPKYAEQVSLWKRRGGDPTARGAFLSLQDHGDPVWYRNIKLRSVPSSEQLDRSPVTPAAIPPEAHKHEMEIIERIESRKPAPPKQAKKVDDTRKPVGPRFGMIDRIDARFDSLIPPNAKLEKLADGFEWSEGPVWVKQGGYLLFSDIPRNSVMQWKPGEMAATLFFKPSGYTGGAPFTGEEPGSNGLLIDSQGRLVLCQHGDRRVARREPDGSFTTLADRYRGKRLNSPNDGAFKSNGDLYFTDPPYGLPQREKDPARELDFFGVYRLSTDGTLTLLTKEMTRPNGIAFSPDEMILYVAQSDPEAALWKAFDVQADGTLSQGRVFFDATAWAKAGRPGLPDGLKVDRAGNVFATGPGGVHVFAPDGTQLGSIDTGERTANCAWGGDGTVLYITADMYLCRIQTTTRGNGW